MATEGSSHSRSPLIKEILRYLVEHPDAKDTIDGIARWWVASRHAEWKRDQVQTAMDELVARGWIIRRETTPSHVVYGLNKRHLATIVTSLKAEDDK